jgi:hypothetical protein
VLVFAELSQPVIAGRPGAMNNTVSTPGVIRCAVRRETGVGPPTPGVPPATGVHRSLCFSAVLMCEPSTAVDDVVSGSAGTFKIVEERLPDGRVRGLAPLAQSSRKVIVGCTRLRLGILGRQRPAELTHELRTQEGLDGVPVRRTAPV